MSRSKTTSVHFKIKSRVLDLMKRAPNKSEGEETAKMRRQTLVAAAVN